VTEATLEAANAALRNAVESRLAGRSPMAASLEGCPPALEAATRVLGDAAELGIAAGCCDVTKPRPSRTSAEVSETYAEWTPPDYAARVEAVKGFARLVEEARPARVARETHPTSQAFFDLCDSLKEMHRRKSRDYGCPSGEDPLANIRNGARFVGIPSWKGAMVRLSDKVTRLAAYNATGRLENESLEDNLFDLASYALLALLLHREDRDAAP
jgi:hypothetical protein